MIIYNNYSGINMLNPPKEVCLGKAGQWGSGYIYPCMMWKDLIQDHRNRNAKDKLTWNISTTLLWLDNWSVKWWKAFRRVVKGLNSVLSEPEQHCLMFIFCYLLIVTLIVVHLLQTSVSSPVTRVIHNSSCTVSRCEVNKIMQVKCWTQNVT